MASGCCTECRLSGGSLRWRRWRRSCWRCSPDFPARLRATIAPAAVLALTLCAPLAISLGTDIASINDHISDAGYVGALPEEELNLASRYLLAHQGNARYEAAAQSATQIGSLI